MASELALPRVSWDWGSPGRHRCAVAAPPHELWVLGLPLNCCHHNPGCAVTITQGTADPGTQLDSPTQAILPAHAAALTPQPHNCVRSGASCGLLTSLISHFSFFLSGKSCRSLPRLEAPQHPRGGRSGRLPYVREGGTLQNSLCSEAVLIKSQFYGACANYNFLAQGVKTNLLLIIL